MVAPNWGARAGRVAVVSAATILATSLAACITSVALTPADKAPPTGANAADQRDFFSHVAATTSKGMNAGVGSSHDGWGDRKWAQVLTGAAAYILQCPRDTADPQTLAEEVGRFLEAAYGVHLAAEDGHYLLRPPNEPSGDPLRIGPSLTPDQLLVLAAGLGGKTGAGLMMTEQPMCTQAILCTASTLLCTSGNMPQAAKP